MRSDRLRVRNASAAVRKIFDALGVTWDPVIDVPAWDAARTFEPARMLRTHSEGEPPTGAADRIRELEELYAAAERTNANLQTALQSSRRIGMAVGILMALQKVDEHDAFGLLRSASQHRNTKLRDLAEEVVQTGTLSPNTSDAVELR